MSEKLVNLFSLIRSCICHVVFPLVGLLGQLYTFNLPDVGERIATVELKEWCVPLNVLVYNVVLICFMTTCSFSHVQNCIH